MWLLLHGTPLTPAVWDGVRPALASVHPVVAPLLPRPSGPLDAQAEIAAHVLADLTDTAAPLHVVGHSFGGQVALEIALNDPSRVASLTVLCSRASPFPAFAATAASLRSGGVLDVEASIHRWFLPDEVEGDGSAVRYARRCIEEADRATWADELDAIATYDRGPELPSIATPTTLIAAEHDHVGTPDEMSSMAAAIPGATCEVITGASHMSPFLRPHDLAGRLLTAAGRGGTGHP